MSTTTSIFQFKPDYYNSIEECTESFRNKYQTNSRYRNFTQTHFTAGDEEQFQHYRYNKNGNIYNTEIPLESNIFHKTPDFQNEQIFEGYKNLEATNILETFRYLFNKFKKGIFVKISNNILKVFLPFSNVNFVNEWSDNIKIDPKYTDLYSFLKYTNTMEGRTFYKNNVNEFTNTWYANNALVRYEYPIRESDTNISIIKNMLEELCTNRRIPDIEFFINRRDFPLLTRNGTEPYFHIWNSLEKPLVSYKYDKYVPILSMSKTDNFADILIPSHEDWSRVQVKENKFFYKSHINVDDNFNNDWDSKKPTAVFRGSSTGYGISIDTNQRLKVAYISSIAELDENGISYIDAGITKWNTRPRKFIDSIYLQTIEIENLPFKLVNKLSALEQSNYKYIIHINGHVSAFRLSYELGMNSVILIVKNDWKMWYSNMLKEYVHYIPIKEDLSDIIDKIKWCRNNDDKCKDITKNAKDFYIRYLQKDGIFDYLQKVLVDLKREIGSYMYNIMSPLDIQIQNEYKEIKKLKKFPATNKKLSKFSEIPNIGRSYGLLKGIHWIINMNNNFKKYAVFDTQIFTNKLGTVNKFTFLNIQFSVKTTRDDNKIKEHIHETFVGLTCINKLVKIIPNFVYNFGLFKKNNTDYNVITEYITGQTFKEYISSKNFIFHEYILILLQICLALHVAQKEYCLVHNDLTPWNIIIQKFKDPITVEYIINHKKVIRIKTTIIPVIIDYGKAHVVYDNIHYGFINMFKFSSITDIISILVTSVYQICTEKYLEKNDFNSLLKLTNFITNTNYRRELFTSSKDLKSFLYKAKKYSNLILENKYELETKTPYDLYNYIRKNLRCKFDIENIYEYTSLMNRCIPEQIFDYILSINNEERGKSYIKSLEQIKNNITSFTEKDPILTYYIAQNIETSMEAILRDIDIFSNNITTITSFNKIIINIIDYIRTFYDNKISKLNMNYIFNITKNMLEFKLNNYDENIFLLPYKVKDMFINYSNNDITDYKNVLEHVFVSSNRYKLKEVHKTEYIMKNSKVFDINTLELKLHNTNSNTVIVVATELYTKNIDELKRIIIKDENINNKIKMYSNILSRSLKPINIK